MLTIDGETVNLCMVFLVHFIGRGDLDRDRELWEAPVLFDFGIYIVMSLIVLFYYYFWKTMFLDN